MTIDDFPEDASPRPSWLITLADLALLLVGFFVFLQASQTLDRAALARGIRAGFGITTEAPPPAAMPVAAASLAGFAPGSAVLPDSPDAVIAWAGDAARDPRVTLTITGGTDGTPDDIDSDTRGAAVLAADRARAVAAAISRAGVIAPDRLIITTATMPGSRRVLVTAGFTGERP